MIIRQFSINQPLDVIKAAIQFAPNLGHEIMNSSCNVQCIVLLPLIPLLSTLEFTSKDSKENKDAKNNIV